MATLGKQRRPQDREGILEGQVKNSEREQRGNSRRLDKEQRGNFRGLDKEQRRNSRGLDEEQEGSSKGHDHEQEGILENQVKNSEGIVEDKSITRKRRLDQRTLLDGSKIRLNRNIESDMNVNWIKFKHFLSLY